MASALPLTSALIITEITFLSVFEDSMNDFIFWACFSFRVFFFLLSFLDSLISFACFSESTCLSSLPVLGAPDNPYTLTGIEGVASVNSSPISFSRIRDLPYSSPTIIKSPFVNFPSLIRMVATGPLPLSTPDSITVPMGLPSNGADKSSTSDCSKIDSSKSSTPSPLIAETFTNITSPPRSSGIISKPIRSFLTFS